VVRYGNRKLYDTHARRYVTLDELGRLIGSGLDVLVRDQKTSQDITTVVLGQVLVDTLRRRTTTIPQRILWRLIRIAASGDESPPPPAPDATLALRHEAERIASEFISRGRLGLEDAVALRQAIVQSASKIVGDAQRAVERRLNELVALSEREFGVSPSLTNLKERLLALETTLPFSRPAAMPRRRRPSRTRKPRRHS
jgi:polyhydroxyalkanoate synthesis repressor PhaR